MPVELTVVRRFKKSGQYDRLRKELLKEFRQSVGALCPIPTVRGYFS